MDFLNSILIGLPVFIILLAPLMFIHELGHFLAAKRAGIRVEEFGMGFPPRAVRLFRRGDTEYTLNWLPIGAFVRMTGEEDPTDPHSFAAQPKRWRLLTLAAGPFMNFLGGFVILMAAYLFFAMQPTEFRYAILSVAPNGAAESIGFQPGDVVLSINGVDMTQRLADGAVSPNDEAAYLPLRTQARESIGREFSAVVLRRDAADPNNDALREVNISGQIPADANPQAPLGVGIGRQVTKSAPMAYSIGGAANSAINDIVMVLVGFVRAPIDLIQQRIPAELARPVGPIGITNIGVTLIEERESQGLFPFIRFAAFISIILGITNLLPIPALDGGRILFILIEALRGRRVDPQREQWVHAIGMMVLLGLSAIIIVLDIVNPISIR